MIDLGKYSMENDPMKQRPAEKSEPVRENRPNEQSRLNIDEFLRITDPETQQVFVEQRA